MRVFSEISLKDFNFWGGAKDAIADYTDKEIDIIENVLDESYPDGLDETKLNDIFWFEKDWIDEVVGKSE